MHPLVHQLMGLPFVYNKVRPLMLGGIDTSPVYTEAEVQASDVVVDVGCGTGAALSHLSTFKQYYGFDLDHRAIAAAQETYGHLPEVQFEAREMLAADIEKIQPNVCVLAGLLHHLDDQSAIGLLSMLRSSPSLRRVTTLDVSFFPEKTLSNILTVLDRGQYPRRPEGYVQLAKEAGYQLVKEVVAPSKKTSDRIQYWVMALEPVN